MLFVKIHVVRFIGSKCHSPGHSGFLWQQQQQHKQLLRLIIIINKMEYTSGKI